MTTTADEAPPMTTELTHPTPEATPRWTVGPVTATPYAWPFDGSVDTKHLAVICIDWQVDFCGPGGYVDRMGYDIALTRAGLPATARLLAHARATGMTVIHTREGHAPDLGDLPANKRWRSAQIGAEIGGRGPRVDAFSYGVNRAGRSCPKLRPIEGEVNHRQTRQGRLLCDEPGPGAPHQRASRTSC